MMLKNGSEKSHSKTGDSTLVTTPSRSLWYKNIKRADCWKRPQSCIKVPAVLFTITHGGLRAEQKDSEEIWGGVCRAPDIPQPCVSTLSQLHFQLRHPALPAAFTACSRLESVHSWRSCDVWRVRSTSSWCGPPEATNCSPSTCCTHSKRLRWHFLHRNKTGVNLTKSRCVSSFTLFSPLLSHISSFLADCRFLFLQWNILNFVVSNPDRQQFFQPQTFGKPSFFFCFFFY